MDFASIHSPDAPGRGKGREGHDCLCGGTFHGKDDDSYFATRYLCDKCGGELSNSGKYMPRPKERE